MTKNTSDVKKHSRLYNFVLEARITIELKKNYIMRGQQNHITWLWHIMRDIYLT